MGALVTHLVMPGFSPGIHEFAGGALISLPFESLS
jgi:hypothetical protein